MLKKGSARQTWIQEWPVEKMFEQIYISWVYADVRKPPKLKFASTIHHHKASHEDNKFNFLSQERMGIKFY